MGDKQPAFEQAQARDRLSVKRLGPIQDFTVVPRPLTLLVGPQASGKSLVAQLLYCFRDLGRQIVARVTPALLAMEHWEHTALKDVFDGLRGVPLGYFAHGTGYLKYVRATGEAPWQASVYHNNRRVRPNGELRRHIQSVTDAWLADPSAVTEHVMAPAHVFIPTERATFTRLAATQPQSLYHPQQPEPLRRFAELLQRSGQAYDLLRDGSLLGDHAPSQVAETRLRAAARVLQLERSALGGEAYLPSAGPKNWKWRVDPTRSAGGSSAGTILPIEATASGQMEAWPLFVMLAVYGGVDWRLGCRPTFYIEEPETHLHPDAQVLVLQAVTELLGQGCAFVITTHSPYVLFALNNLLLKLQKSAPQSLPPLPVAAYRLGEGGGVSIVDETTGLVDATELEQVADRLGTEFEALLDG